MPASTVKISVCLQCIVVCWGEMEKQLSSSTVQMIWILSSGLVWEGGENFLLNRRQSGLLSKLVGALWPQSLLKLLLTFRVTPFCMLKALWKLQHRADRLLLPMSCGQPLRHIRWVCCYLSAFAYLHLCNSSKCYSFSSSDWLRFHAQISSLREN